jgi:dual-specificity kinase
MSTPSTATATLPPPHHRYYSRHQQAFGHPATSYGSIVKTTPRLPQPQFNPSYSSSSDKKLGIRLPPPSPAFYTPEAMNGSSRSRNQKATKNAKKPDWEEFYKNGVPQEVIIIDDDETPDPNLPNQSDASLDRPDKKRKTGPSSNYDPVYNPQPSYSTTHTPYYDNSSSANHTASTDRTAPLYKGTGSTSSGPTVANGNNFYPTYDDGMVGQKRKRTTRAVEELKVTKRREIEKIQSPFSAYVPPPKPPHKARDVYVKIIKDVSTLLSINTGIVLTSPRLLEIKIQRLTMTMTVITASNQILILLQNVSTSPSYLF